MTRRRLTLGLAAAVLLAIVAGARLLPGSQRASPDRGWTPPRMPLDAYRLTARERAEQLHMENVLKSACMKGFGIDYLTDAADIRDRATATMIESRTRRYGIADPDRAAELGYHRRPQPASSTPDQQLTEAQRRVLVGPRDGEPDHYNGKAIPRNGCVAWAARTLHTSPIQPGDLVNDLDYRILGTAQRDPRMVALYASWSRCMLEQGIDYGTPVEAANDRAWTRTRTATREEIRRAVADIGCKQDVRLLERAYAIEAELQKAAIAEHAARLALIKRSLAAQRAALRQAKAEHGI